MRGYRRQDILIFLALIFGYLVCTWLWLYRGGFAEHDCYTMAAAIVQARLQGTGLNEPMLYFPISQPFYYLLFFHWPGAPWASLDRLIPLMNGVSWLAMGIGVGLLYWLFRSVATRGWALVGVTAVITSQTYFEMSTYGHPTSLALFLTLLGTCILVVGYIDDKDWGARQWGALLGFGVCFLLAFYTRIDIIFMIPFVLALIFAKAKRRWWTLASIGGVILIILVSYPLLTRILFSPQASVEKGDGSILQTLRMFLRPRISIGLFYYYYAAGAGACLALGLTAVFLAYRRYWVPLMYGAFMLCLPLAYFLINPQPSRRFLPVIIAGGLIIAMGGSCLRRLRWPWLATFCALIMVLNLGSYAIFQGLFRMTHRDFSQTILMRLGDSPFGNHRIRQNYLWWDQARWNDILGKAPNDTLFIGEWIDIAGFYLNATRTGAIVKSRPVRMEPNAHLFDCSVGNHQYHFLEWYAGANPDIVPAKHDQVYILAPMKQDELKKLPAGKMYTADTEILRRRPF